MDWSREEVEAIVADYLQMLTMELAGQLHGKTEHRQNLLKKLVDRNGGSIEFKHANISAAKKSWIKPHWRPFNNPLLSLF